MPRKIVGCFIVLGLMHIRKKRMIVRDKYCGKQKGDELYGYLNFITSYVDL